MQSFFFLFFLDRLHTPLHDHLRGVVALFLFRHVITGVFHRPIAFQQAKTQLGLDLQPVQTVVEKRATIAATPAAFAAKAQLPARLGPGLYLAGDYLHPVYPSTLEGAVQSAQAAVAALLVDY